MKDPLALGDFLVESRCKNGHTSSVSFRAFRAKQAEMIARVLRLDRCAWNLTEEGDKCGSRVEVEVHDLGASDADVSGERAKRIADTLPAMNAVTPPQRIAG